MKIAHIIDSGGMYGAEICVMNLIKAQLKDHHSSILISTGKHGDKKKEIELEAQRQNIEYHSIRLHKYDVFTNNKTISAIIKQNEIDIIHSHGYKSDILIGTMKKHRRGIPAISTIHGFTATKVLKKVWIYRLLGCISLRNFNRVVTVSSATAEHPFLNNLGIDCVTIHNGIPELNFKINHSHSFAPSRKEGTCNIIAVGRLAKEKGYEILINALKLLDDDGYKFHLFLIGDGPEKSALESVAMRSKIEDKITFSGFVPNAYRLLPHFDLFVISSLIEAFPINILEAMQAGIPIISTNVGDIPKILDGGYGNLVSSGEPYALAEAIKGFILNKKEALLRAEATRERALNEYSIEKMASRYFIQYKEAAEDYKRALN